MKEILCHYCARVVARVQSGSSIQRGAIMVCKRCAEIEGIVGPDSSKDVGRLLKMFGMK